MGLFKDDDISGMEGLGLDDGALEGFGDDSIDKDLLNQIFADDSGSPDDAEDAHLDVDSEDFYLDDDANAIIGGAYGKDTKEEAKEEVIEEKKEEVIEEKAAETVAGADNEVQAEEKETAVEAVEAEKETESGKKEEGKAVAEVKPAEEVQAETPAQDAISPISVNDDFINNEAMKAMNEERLNGTVTVITQNTTITGSISSDGSLEVMGTITGDIECAGKVYIHGRVSGGVVASEIYVNTPKLNGGLISEGTVRIGVGTVVLGDVTGTSAYIAGAVRGNIDIEGPLVIESTAVLKGDIKAQTITIKSGAIVDGYCSLYQTSVDMEKIFEE